MEAKQGIGEALRSLRQAHGYTMGELAEKCGISTSYLSRLEKGGSVPSFTVAAALAGALDVDAQFLVDADREQAEANRKLRAAFEVAVPLAPNHVRDELLRLPLDVKRWLATALDVPVKRRVTHEPGVNGVAVPTLHYE